MTEVLRRYRLIFIAVLMLLFILLIWLFGKPNPGKIPTRGVFVESIFDATKHVGWC